MGSRMSTAAEALPPAFWGLPPEMPGQSARADSAESGASQTKFISLLNGELVEAEPPADQTDLFGEDGLSFGDFLDVINPLQHIPLVSSIYRALTGDEISTGARLAGGTIYGGPLGLIGAVVNEAVEDATGRDVGESALAAMGFGGEDSAGEAVADASGLAPDDPPVEVQSPPRPGEAPGEALTLASAARTAMAEPAVSKPVDIARAPVETAASTLGADAPLELSASAQAALLRLTGAPAAVAGRAQAEAARDVVATQQKTALRDTAPAAAARPAAAAPVALTPPARATQTASLVTAQENATATDTALSPAQIPSAMMAALEKYEALRRGRTANPS